MSSKFETYLTHNAFSMRKFHLYLNKKLRYILKDDAITKNSNKK